MTLFSKKTLSRYALIIFMVFALSSTTFYLYLHYRSNQNVKWAAAQMASLRESVAIIDSCIISLHRADNYGRLFAITSKNEFYNKYKDDVQLVGRLLSKLNSDSLEHRVSPSGQVNDLLKEKSEKLYDYVILKQLSDSLLIEAKELSMVEIPSTVVERKITKANEQKADTLDTASGTRGNKRTFVGRLLNAFSLKKAKPDSDTQPRAVQKGININAGNTPGIISDAIEENHLQNRENYEKLLHVNDRLKASEREILTINNTLVNQIIQILEEYKTKEQQHINSAKIQLNTGFQEADSRYKILSGLVLFVLVTFVSIILYNIWKIYKYQKKLIVNSEDSEKNAASKAAFLAGMSHEIRTPLNSVIGFSEQLSMSKLDDTQQEQLAAITNSSKTMLEIVNQVLDFSKFETGKMVFDQTPFIPYEILDDAFNTLSIQANSKGIYFKKLVDVDPELFLKGDALRLKQVLINLLGNAIKFTQEGGVTLQARTVAENKDCIRLIVKVKDTGVGISKENEHHVFEEFSQVASAQKEASQQGTGLGLAISKRIIEQQGGYIEVSSEEGKGSVFKFSLPFEICEKATTNTSPAPDALNPSSIEGKRLLVADDNKLNILLMSTILKKWNLHFDTAKNGVEALALFSEGEYDLVVTDIEMPEMGGLELTDRIRSGQDTLKADVPIIALTANVFKEDHDRYMASGLNGVILKPFTEQSLLTGITEVLEETKGNEALIDV